MPQAAKVAYHILQHDYTFIFLSANWGAIPNLAGEMDGSEDSSRCGSPLWAPATRSPSPAASHQQLRLLAVSLEAVEARADVLADRCADARL